MYFPAVPPDPEAWGASTAYRDTSGHIRRPPPSTLAAVLDALGASPASPSPPTGDVGLLVLDRRRLAEMAPAGGVSELHCEDGAVVALAPGQPPPLDLPYGYHQWHQLDDRGGAEPRIVRFALSPGTCHPIGGVRAWGWALQLYALRSRSSWGIGDLGDLTSFGRWSTREGASFCLINPIHAANPTLPQEPSPYTPTSRCFRNPLYLRVEDVPGFSDLATELEPAARAGRALLAERRIDRDAVFALKLGALERLWERFIRRHRDRSFDRYLGEQGALLRDWANYCALREHHGAPWPTWPVEHRDVRGDAVARFSEERAARVEFFAWLQWLLDAQLAVAGTSISLVSDLAVGVGHDAADTWLWPDCFAHGVAVGAPPDEFNRLGQNWDLVPFHPWGLRRSAYEPFVRMLRAAFSHAGGVRLDHVMGLFRLFWIPEGGSPEVGTYVRYPARELLDLVALESWRAGAWVIGEDLGTVEEEVRIELAARGVLSSRLLWFEDDPPASWPASSVASVGTHDLPTVAGLWGGKDLQVQRQLGLRPDPAGAARMRARLRAATGAPEDLPVGQLIGAVHRALDGAGSVLVAASLEDALALEERPNLPGTRDERPNWSLALPVLLEDLHDQTGIAEVLSALHSRRGGSAS